MPGTVARKGPAKPTPVRAASAGSTRRRHTSTTSPSTKASMSECGATSSNTDTRTCSRRSVTTTGSSGATMLAAPSFLASSSVASPSNATATTPGKRDRAPSDRAEPRAVPTPTRTRTRRCAGDRGREHAALGDERLHLRADPRVPARLCAGQEPRDREVGARSQGRRTADPEPEPPCTRVSRPSGLRSTRRGPASTAAGK